MLKKNWKKFIKKVVTRPFTLNRKDFTKIPYDLKPHEIFHSIMLISGMIFFLKFIHSFSNLEAKFEVELTYFILSLQKYKFV